MITATIFIVIAYLLGSLSAAIIVCNLMGLPDPRTQGSGNPGTTNVLRIGGKLPAILTLVGDALKGFIPVFLAGMLGVKGFWLGWVAFAALAGHVFPVFFKFKGGKGIATGFGVLFALSAPLAIAAAVTWILVAAISSYSSLAALIAVLLAPIYAAIFSNVGYLIPLIAIAILVVWRHFPNIKRLQAGTESKIHLK